MKRRKLAGLVAVAALTLVACGADEPDDERSDDVARPSDAQEDSAGEDDEDVDGDAGDEGGLDDADLDDADPEEPADDESEADVPAAFQFTGTTMDGEAFDGAALAGQPAVFWFWAPWCSKCRAEAGHVADVASAYDGEVNVVGIASLGGEADMRDFIATTGTNGFPHLADEDGEVWRHFEIIEQSTFAVVTADGEVTHRGSLSPDELSHQVAELAG